LHPLFQPAGEGCSLFADFSSSALIPCPNRFTDKIEGTNRSYSVPSPLEAGQKKDLNLHIIVEVKVLSYESLSLMPTIRA